MLKGSESASPTPLHMIHNSFETMGHHAELDKRKIIQKEAIQTGSVSDLLASRLHTPHVIRSPSWNRSNLAFSPCICMRANYRWFCASLCSSAWQRLSLWAPIFGCPNGQIKPRWKKQGIAPHRRYPCPYPILRSEIWSSTQYWASLKVSQVIPFSFSSVVSF